MKAYLFLLLIVIAYSIPNPVYVIKDCFEKLYNVNENSELMKSVNDELLKWKVKEFYEKVDAVDPTLKPKIEELLNNPRLYGMGYVPTDATYMGWEGKPLKDIGNIYHSIVDRLLEIEAYIEIGLGE